MSSKLIQNKLNKYIPLVDFIAAILGKNSEVALHDLTDLDHSIISIKNNYISKREVGAPATDLILKILKENSNEKNDFITNYNGDNKINNSLRSSTFFIRDDDMNLIGLISVNTDETALNTLMETVSKVYSLYKKEPELERKDDSESENLSSIIEELAQCSINKITSSKGITIEYLKQEDKIHIVEELHQKGIFLLKGAVKQLAKTLGSSEATIYRYVQKIKNQE
ncbi:PAS domain-containing protein [Clostridium sp. CM028]|uniref:helix-turn-helix transcriptional regulator n=1 Tax=unclassified Clostridium TaxID=2614128 RepID=UPI001C0D0BCF|nr:MULTISPECIES: PAS domain-containing protein [unclassified Clostridium]MBU3092764.1 PAS domain-containing protein [Clostridium sp. CF011]MBW9149822.1 PAS domain-containing protein [Clostridium sp. CM028]WAG71184.1 PAS domain-containing protein [Clostridium sp. CF011]WLC62767.1 PAS domain-containing protein [Clostridium sp. CM028]